MNLQSFTTVCSEEYFSMVRNRVTSLVQTALTSRWFCDQDRWFEIDIVRNQVCFGPHHCQGAFLSLKKIHDVTKHQNQTAANQFSNVEHSQSRMQAGEAFPRVTSLSKMHGSSNVLNTSVTNQADAIRRNNILIKQGQGLKVDPLPEQASTQAQSQKRPNENSYRREQNMRDIIHRDSAQRESTNRDSISGLNLDTVNNLDFLLQTGKSLKESKDDHGQDNMGKHMSPPGNLSMVEEPQNQSNFVSGAQDDDAQLLMPPSPKNPEQLKVQQKQEPFSSIVPIKMDISNSNNMSRDNVNNTMDSQDQSSNRASFKKKSRRERTRLTTKLAMSNALKKMAEKNQQEMMQEIKDVSESNKTDTVEVESDDY